MLPTPQIDCSSTSESNESEVTHMITEFLTKINISPGIYEKDDAREILNEICNFLNLKFIDRISDIDQSTLLSNLLDCEGKIIEKRIQHRKKTQHKFQVQMEYNSIDEFSEKNTELNILIEVCWYSIEVAIKHWSESSKTFSLEDWFELHAIAKQIIIYSSNSVHLFFKLAEYQIHIFEDYSFKIISKDISALKSFSDAFDKFVISSEKLHADDPKGLLNQSMDELDESFEDEFKITFIKLCMIIHICLDYLTIGTKLVTIDELYRFCIIKHLEISKEDLMNGLTVLSLTKENMNYDFYPSEGRNRQYRHECKPIIKFPDNEHYLINSASLDNVLYRIIEDIDQGYILYNDNFIDSKRLLS